MPSWNDPPKTTPYPAGTAPNTSAAPQGDPRVRYNPDGSVRQSWIGHDRGVGRTRLTPKQKGAYNPYGDKRIVDAYSPMRNPAIRDAYKDAGAVQAHATILRDRAERALAEGYNAPGKAMTVNPVMVDPATGRADAGISAANVLLDNTNRSRAAQRNVYNTAMMGANGEIVLAGENMANQAGVIANEQFQRAGSEANQAYGSNAITAAQAYANALAAQNFATMQAGRTAGRQVVDASGQAVLQQAALASMARGNNIGMALRGAQGNAAAQAQAANVQAARLMDDANSQAAYQASLGQRAAQSTEAQGNLAMQGTHERAGFASAAAEEQARFAAAEIAAKAQQDYLALAEGSATNMRSGDVASTNAATNIANTGLSTDQMVNNVVTGNADRSIRADESNQRNEQVTNELGFKYDTLDSGNLNAAADRFQSDQQAAMNTRLGIGQADSAAEQALAAAQMGSEQQLVAMMTQLDEASRTRMIQEFAARQGKPVDDRGIQIAGAALSAGGAILAAYLSSQGGRSGYSGPAAAAPTTPVASDRRVKRDIKSTAAPDFRKAGSYSYRYKDPNLAGAAPGKHRGPMAQELPKQLVQRGKDGVLRVDSGRLALELASAVGALQRKVG